MLIHGYRPDIPESPAPPSERREQVHEQTVRPSFPGTGPRELEESFYESRPAMLRRHDYTHDQSMGQVWENDGSHVRVGRAQPFPTGVHEAGPQPQRPTFRIPAPSWTDALTDRS